MFAHLITWFQNESIIVLGLIAAIFFDIILGTGRAIVEHRVNSGISRKGIFRKVVVILIIAGAKTFAFRSGMPLPELICAVYLKTELESIFENMALLGLPVPEQITKFFALLPPYVEREVSRKTQYKLEALKSDGAHIEV